MLIQVNLFKTYFIYVYNFNLLFLIQESTYSTEDIFSLTPETRNCIDNREIKLNVMSNYSYVNCLAECRSNLIYKLCGCIPYNLPNNGK